MAITLYLEKGGDLLLVKSPSSRAWYTIWDNGKASEGLRALKDDPVGWGWEISEKLISKLIFVADDLLLFWSEE